MPVDYFTTNGNKFFANCHRFTHPELHTTAVLTPLTHIADPSYYNDIVKYIGNRACLFDLTIIDHPAFKELQRILTHEPDYKKILEYVKNFVLYKNNASSIKQFIEREILPVVKQHLISAELLIQKTNNEKLRLILEISKHSIFDPGNLTLCQRFLAELLEVTTTTTAFDPTVNPAVTDWNLIILNQSLNMNLNDVRIQLNQNTIQQFNQYAFNVLDTVNNFGQYALIPDILSRQKAFGDFLLNVNTIINENLQELIPTDISGNPTAQTIDNFITQKTELKQDFGVVFGAINCPFIEHLLTKRGYVKNPTVDRIPIFK